MRVLVPDTQDLWNDVDWAMFNFINHLSTEVDPYDLPSAYYDNITAVAREKYSISIKIIWVAMDTMDTFVYEPAGWDLDLSEQELTVFVLKWR